MSRRIPRALIGLSVLILLVSIPFQPLPAASGDSAAARKLQSRAGGAAVSSSGVRTLTLYDGSTVRIGADGFGSVTDPRGNVRPVVFPMPAGRSALGGAWGTDDREILRRLASPPRGRFVPGEVIVVPSTPPARRAPAAIVGPSAASPLSGDAAVDAALRRAGAVSSRPLVSDASEAAFLATSAGDRLDLSRAMVVHLEGVSPESAAESLSRTVGIAYAGPNWIVAPMSVAPRSLPPLESLAPSASGLATGAPAAGAASASTLPTNFALTSSFESWLNAGGVNASGAFDILSRRYGKLPGDGVIVTNVSLGDLTDQSMADAGDPYVQFFGPTTVVIKGQRYLDIPSMPLIPTWSASPGGKLDARGAVENVDPFLAEVLLDFSVMAPLPHDRQRPGATGDGFTDLLGLAPGAQYRLVVPEQPTIANILAALVAASKQKPKPDVITASLGFGVDAEGFPGRYLEDDPVVRQAVKKIVNDLGIVVCISANDGTRLFTPAAVGPDGGSAPTDLVQSGEKPTSIGQVALSTAPSRIDDSGAIDVGGSTLDDVLSAPPQGSGALAGTGSFPETRLNGGTDFSSGFGTRVNVSAPSDNIPAMIHACGIQICTAQSVVAVLNGGTSASTPMTAAAAAIVIQSARLTGSNFAPAAVRDLLIRTGRVLPNPPQIGRPLQVGAQIDVTSAVESVLGPDATPAIPRLAVAHRQPLSFLGATFVEATDPSAIDLAGPLDFLGEPSGQNVTGPITIAPDITGLGSPSKLTFALRIGSQTFTQTGRVFRLLPEKILGAAGLSVVSTTPQTVSATYEIRSGNTVLASAPLALGFSPSDGTYSEALPPVAPAVLQPGKSLSVAYDISRVRFLNKPRLVISSVNHWSPASAPLFRIERSIPLTAQKGTVSIPASSFTGGAGIYGIGIEQDSVAGDFFGWFTSVRVMGVSGETRPPAPTLDAGGSGPGFVAGVTRGAPGFTLGWDARSVPHAAGALLEISAPGPTLYGSINNFINQNGDRRDANGVDSGSVLWYRLPGVSGSLALDAAALGLPSSLFFTARVFATDGQNVTGLASPVSGLEFDDGVTPGAELINDFDIVPGSGSTVITAGFDALGNLADSAIRPYDPSMGAYGTPFAINGDGTGIYYMFGSDASLHRLSAIRYDWFDLGQLVESYDSITGARLSSTPVDAGTQFEIIAGRVDSTRHRASLLGISASDFSDNVLPFDMTSGSLGAPVFADAGTDDRGIMTTLDVDPVSGKSFVARMLWGDLCFFFGGFAASVDLDHATASNVAPIANCATGMAADQGGSDLHVVVGPIFGFPNLFPVARHQTVDQTTLAASNLDDLGARSPLFPVVDPVNGVLLVGFSALDSYTIDNNAMSAVGVFDSQSGRPLATLPYFNFIAQVFGINGLVGNERGIQVDPATRTAWTYGPSGIQVQQFRY